MRLRIESIVAGYGGTRILDNVSIEVVSGETVAILGPNGSGKSTFVKTIMGLTDRFEGKIEWAGEDISSLPPHRRARLGLGYVPQTENVFPGLSVQENLQMGAYLLAARDVREELVRTLDLFPNLRERLALRAGNLSGGERRMLSLAMTMMMKPRCLLLDEPTSDLAPAAIDVVFRKIGEIRREFKLPMLIVEQNVRRALEIADRVCVLVRGQKVLEQASSSSSEEELGTIFLRT